MTPQFEANELLKIWQRNRHRPPELRLVETKEDFSRLHDDTMAMLRADQVLSSCNDRG